jgi:hypothetical protein
LSTTDETSAGDDVLARAGLFQGVAAEAREALASALQYADYTRGESVFTRASRATRCSSS